MTAFHPQYVVDENSQRQAVIVSVAEKGAYFVTNALNAEGVCNDGYLHAVSSSPTPLIGTMTSP